MKKEKVNTLKLGLFVTTAVMLFAAAVYYLGNEQNLFQPTFQLYAVFPHAEGLKPGNNVRYAGIDAGTVQNIVITSDSTLRVEMLLQRDMQTYIKKDAVASIGTDGLVGNKLVNINPSLSSEPTGKVENQDYLRSYRQPATDDMLEILGKTNENIALFSLQLLKISQEINTGSGTMNLLLKDPMLATDLRQSASNLKDATQSLHQLSGQLRQTLATLSEGDGLLHALLYDTTITEDIRSFTGRLNGIADQKIDPLLSGLTQSAESITQSSRIIRDLLQDVQAGDGAVGALLRDSSLENDLQITLTNIRQSSERFNENMEAMRHNFLFRGYFKKQEKVERKSLQR